MGRYVTKPVEIEATLFTGKNGAEVKEFVNRLADAQGDDAAGMTWFITRGMAASTGNQAWNYVKDGSEWGSDVIGAVYDYLHDTWVGVKAGQWIIQGTKGEFYPCDPDVFEQKYTPV